MLQKDWYDSPVKTIVREYPNLDVLQADADRAGALGWRLISTSELQQRPGCMRMLTLGLFTLIWKPPAHIMATYSRD